MCRNQRLSLTHTWNTRPSDTWYVKNIFKRGPNARASDCVCREVVVGWCDKKHLSWQADYSLFISTRACKKSLGSIWCSLGQGCSCAGPLVQASRASSVWFEVVEDPAPLELCFARLSSNESEICPRLVELSFVWHGKSFPGSGWCNCGARLSLFIWGRLRPQDVICGKMCKGTVAAVAGRDGTKPAANASCRHEEGGTGRGWEWRGRNEIHGL